MTGSTTMLKNLFESKKVELPGGWKRPHIGKRHDFCPHQTLFGMSYRGGRCSQALVTYGRQIKEPILCLWGET